jgi:hypothetical protein
VNLFLYLKDNNFGKVFFYLTKDEDDLKIEDVEREMETEQQIAEVESKEEPEGKEESVDVDLLLQEGEGNIDMLIPILFSVVI